MKAFGMIVKFATPGFLCLGPIFLAEGLGASLMGVVGGILLGLGLVGMYYHKQED